MPSEVTLCNLALSHLGDAATVASISPPEGSAQAEHCERFYPIARDTLLEMHDWSFATKRATLAPLAAAPPDWGHAYALPSDFIRLIGFVQPGAAAWASPPPDGHLTTRYEQDPTRCALEGQLDRHATEAAADGSLVLYAARAQACIRYLYRATDTTRFPPLFAEALTWLLASYLAGPVLKGEAGAQAALRCTVVALGQDGRSGRFGRAAAADANQQRAHLPAGHLPAWLADR